MKYKLIIFDLDGTILNTLGDLCASCNAALDEFQLPRITLEQTKSFVGNGIRDLILHASNFHEKADDILLSFKKYYSKHYNDFTTSYEGIEQVFRYCKVNEIKIGVFTNKVEDIAKNLVQAHFPSTMEFVYGEVSERPRKPDPIWLNSIIRMYGFSKEEVLYIGDSEVDIKACRNADIDGLFVSYGFRSRSQLLRETNRIVDSALEIIHFLGE